MEDSKQSTMNRCLVSKEETVSEESGWTVYFDDFLSAQNKNYNDYSSDFEGSSMVSDAASSAAWKASKVSNYVEFSSVKRCNGLSVKKRRTRGDWDDDALEDTASSPVNSPKVSEVRRSVLDLKEKNDNLSNSQGKEHFSELQKEETKELGFVERENQCTDLRKSGLCLIPLSMLVNYIE